MAAIAAAGNVVVVKRCGQPPGSDVTQLAVITTCYMLCIFTPGLDTIMAVEASRSDTVMIEIDRIPAIGRMACRTVITGRDMCWMLTFRNNTVMAAVTRTNDCLVIDTRCRHPTDGSMTILTTVE